MVGVLSRHIVSSRMQFRTDLSVFSFEFGNFMYSQRRSYCICRRVYCHAGMDDGMGNASYDSRRRYREQQCTNANIR